MHAVAIMDAVTSPGSGRLIEHFTEVMAAWIKVVSWCVLWSHTESEVRKGEMAGVALGMVQDLMEILVEFWGRARLSTELCPVIILCDIQEVTNLQTEATTFMSQHLCLGR